MNRLLLETLDALTAKQKSTQPAALDRSIAVKAKPHQVPSG